jgi:hypothetical protein
MLHSSEQPTLKFLFTSLTVTKHNETLLNTNMHANRRLKIGHGHGIHLFNGAGHFLHIVLVFLRHNKNNYN